MVPAHADPVAQAAGARKYLQGCATERGAPTSIAEREAKAIAGVASREVDPISLRVSTRMLSCRFQRNLSPLVRRRLSSMGAPKQNDSWRLVRIDVGSGTVHSDIAHHIRTGAGSLTLENVGKIRVSTGSQVPLQKAPLKIQKTG